MGCSTRVAGDACVGVTASMSGSGWRPGVKFVIGWCVCEMLVDLFVTPVVEGGEEEGRRGGTRPLVDPGWT